MGENINLYIDFGSTFTKVTAIDIDKEEVIGSSVACTTVNSDISEGLNNALEKLFAKTGELKINEKFASSSAAGGLKMATIGLVPQLTAEASKRAALGAGAKVQKVFAYKLSDVDIEEINGMDIDVILLCGGTDGGNKDNIIYNAQMIAKSNKDVPIIYAGNKDAAYDCRSELEKTFNDIRFTDNVMPELGEINVEPVRKTIREVFLERIIKAEGFTKAQRTLSGILMPTPSAVLNAAKLLAVGTENETGIGELIVVDPGGSTTDVHSIAKGEPTKEGIELQGLPEPFEKRTVEGDLGLRYTVSSLVEICGIDEIKGQLENTLPIEELKEHIQMLSEDIKYIPQSNDKKKIDNIICKIAVDVACERHVGRIETSYTPLGQVDVQTGKDLTKIENVIGTGGAIISSNNPKDVLEGVLFKESEANILKPMSPKFFVDKSYIMYALGLLGENYPDKAVRMLKKYIVNIG